jgi:hypothetical protein
MNKQEEAQRLRQEAAQGLKELAIWAIRGIMSLWHVVMAVLIMKAIA